MAQTMLKFIMIELLFAVILAQASNINSTVAATLNTSAADIRFIGSNRIEALQLNTLTDVNGSTLTNFQLSYFSRGAPNNLKVFRINQTGTWKYVTSTQNTLSCILVSESTQDLYGLLQFRPDTNSSLRFIYQGSAASFTNSSDSVSSMQMADLTVLRQNCEGVYYNNTLFRVSSGTLVPVVTPTLWNVDSSSESIQYGVAGNILYRYDSSSGTFTELTHYYPPSSGLAYEIRYYPGRLIVVYAWTAQIDNFTNHINQTFSIYSVSPSNFDSVSGFSVVGTVNANLNINILPYLASPQLSKVGIIYTPPNSTELTITIKSIDYINRTLTNLTFQQPNRFINTIRNIPFGNTDFYFGDDYSVVRNASAYNSSSPNKLLVEQAYQYVVNQIMYLRYRNLTGKELTSFKSIIVDTSYPNRLVVLNSYNATSAPNNGSGVNGSIVAIQVDEFNYGSFTKILVLPTPPYISFTVPAFTSGFAPAQSLTWVYLNAISGSTTLTVSKRNQSAPGNLQVITSSIFGNKSIVTMNDNCFLLFDVAIRNFTIATLNGNTTQLEDLGFLMNGSPLINITSYWQLSDNCDRFAVNNNVYYRGPNTTHYSLISNNSNNSTFAPIALDRSITTAIVGTTVWVLNPATNSFYPIYDNVQPFLSTVTVSTFNNRIVISSTNTTAAQVLAFALDPTTNLLTNVLNFNFAGYQSLPKIQISSQLTKVLIIGPFLPPNKTVLQPKYDAFFVDYANNNSRTIELPFNTFPSPLSSYMYIEQQYFYIRSTVYSDGTNNTLTSQENIFFIDQDVTPKLALSTNLTQAQVTGFKRSVLIVGANDTALSLVQTLEGTDQVVVTKSQISKQQANLNSGPQAITGYLVNGQIKLCSVGCSSCSSGNCKGCLSGYAYDQSAYSCYKCAKNCASCSSIQTSTCSSCISGSFLSNSSCLPCDRSCISCNETATSCISCPPSQVYVNGRCTDCPYLCIACSSPTTCITCNKGFVNVNGICRGCSMSCSNCSTTNITQCTSCAPGLSLINSTCISCPDKCQACNNGICTTCIPGFSPNAAGTCVLNCQVTCATCVDNQPATCLSCYSGASLSNGTCVFNISCNSDSSCTDCGQGLGYALVGSTCVAWDSIANCLQCNSPNTDECIVCSNGYFVDDNSLCTACSANCTLCESLDVCTGCAIGFTLPENQTEGQCLQCQSPCATCLGVQTYCLSCVDGYTKKGWKCQNNKNVGFIIKIFETPANLLNDVQAFTVALLAILKLSQTEIDKITFEYFKDGSTDVGGTVTTPDPAASSALLTASLASGTLGTYSVGASSITVNGVTTSSDTSSNKTGLIVGLVVGLAALVTIVVVVVYVIYRMKKQAQILATGGELVIELRNVSGLKNDSRIESNLHFQTQPLSVDQHETGSNYKLEKDLERK